MCEQEKKRQRIYDLLDADIKPKFLCLPYTMQRKKITEKELFKEKRGWRIELKTKRKLFNCSRYCDKDPPQVNKKARRWTESPRENYEDRI